MPGPSSDDADDSGSGAGADDRSAGQRAESAQIDRSATVSSAGIRSPLGSHEVGTFAPTPRDRQSGGGDRIAEFAIAPKSGAADTPTSAKAQAKRAVRSADNAHAFPLEPRDVADNEACARPFDVRKTTEAQRDANPPTEPLRRKSAASGADAPAPRNAHKPRRARRNVAHKTIRMRVKEHCKFVATQPCVVCGRSPSEAHHLRFAQPRALWRKVRARFTVPVRRLHHRELHGYGDEASWWAGVHVDPVPLRSNFGAARAQVRRPEELTIPRAAKFAEAVDSTCRAPPDDSRGATLPQSGDYPASFSLGSERRSAMYESD